VGKADLMGLWARLMMCLYHSAIGIVLCRSAWNEIESMALDQV
jgi:hypothetical protein